MQELLEIGPHYIFVQNTRIKMHQMQWSSQVKKSLQIWVVLQSE